MRNFQIKPSLILLLLCLISCQKETEIDDEQQSSFNYLQEHIFNGKTQWLLSHMEADTEREFNGQLTKVWSDQFANCRTDNIYQFGTLGIKIASIHIDESGNSCNTEEPDFVSQGLVLDFSSDFKKASVFIKGAAMGKLYALPYDHKIKNFDFTHTWEFEEISSETLIIKVLIPADESGGMVEEAAEVTITFKRHQ
jgi:hypothetical protein